MGNPSFNEVKMFTRNLEHIVRLDFLFPIEIEPLI